MCPIVSLPVMAILFLGPSSVRVTQDKEQLSCLAASDEDRGERQGLLALYSYLSVTVPSLKGWEETVNKTTMITDQFS